DARFAEAQYKDALALNPSLLAARHNLALLFARRAEVTGQMAPLFEARRLWQENLNLDPDFHPSRLKLADAYLAVKDGAQAQLHYGAVLKQSPENTEARLGLA